MSGSSARRSSTRWLDNCLEQAGSVPDPKARENVVVALVALGGRERMAHLVRLVGKAAAALSTGDLAEAAVLAAAIRETERDDFSAASDLKKALKTPVDHTTEDDRKAERRERRAARVILTRDNPFFEWWVRRNLSPWPGVGGILQAFQVSLFAAFLLWFLPLLAPLFAFGTAAMMARASQPVGFYLSLVALAMLSAIAGAFVATPGLHRVRVSIVDAVAAGLTAALAGSVMFEVLVELCRGVAGNSDTARLLKAGPFVAFFSFLALAAPGLPLTRLLLAARGRAARDDSAVLRAFGWPALLETIVALSVVRFGRPDWQEVAGLAWIATLLTTITFAVISLRIDASLLIVPSRVPLNRILSAIFRTGPLALVILIAGTGLRCMSEPWLREKSKEYRSFSTGSESFILQSGKSVYLRQMPDTKEAVALTVNIQAIPRDPLGDGVTTFTPFGNPVATTSSFAPPTFEGLNRTSSWVDNWLVVRSGGEMGSSISSGTTQFGLSVMQPKSDIEVCVEPGYDFHAPVPCEVARMPVSPQSLAGWLVGRARSHYEGQEGSKIIVTALASVPSLPVQIPPLDDRSGNKLEPFTITAAADSPVIQFDVTAKAGVTLVEAMTKDDPRHDRTVVLEHRVSPMIFFSIALTDIVRPKLITRLAPGTYRLCSRYFDHQLTGCDAPTYELLPSTAMSATLSAAGTEK